MSGGKPGRGAGLNTLNKINDIWSLGIRLVNLKESGLPVQMNRQA
jgi:hypothetical protein